LVGLGENQAKAALANVGVTNVVVDYQGPDRLGDLYNQFPPYAVVSHTPGPGTPVEPGMTVVLGVRAP
jgi:peptidoglycan glycosyltransferase